MQDNKNKTDSALGKTQLRFFDKLKLDEQEAYPDGKPEKDIEITLLMTEVVTTGRVDRGLSHTYGTLTQHAHHDIFTVRKIKYDEAPSYKNIGSIEPNIINIENTSQVYNSRIGESILLNLNNEFHMAARREDDIEFEAYILAEKSFTLGNWTAMFLRKKFNFRAEGNIFDFKIMEEISYGTIPHHKNKVQVPLIVPINRAAYIYPNGFDKTPFIEEAQRKLRQGP